MHLKWSILSFFNHGVANHLLWATKDYLGMKEGVGVLEQVKEQELAELKETTVENMWLLGSKLFRGIMELNQLFFLV